MHRYPPSHSFSNFEDQPLSAGHDHACRLYGMPHRFSQEARQSFDASHSQSNLFLCDREIRRDTRMDGHLNKVCERNGSKARYRRRSAGFLLESTIRSCKLCRWNDLMPVLGSPGWRTRVDSILDGRRCSVLVQRSYWTECVGESKWHSFHRNSFHWNSLHWNCCFYLIFFCIVFHSHVKRY